jgi:glucose/arabinose dehydrogenase
MKTKIYIVSNAVFLWFFSLSVAFAAEISLEKLKLPEGFQISIYASGLDTPRQMALGDKGVVFVGTMHDKVYALEPSEDLKTVKKVDVVAEKLNYPNGVAFRDSTLYVAEIQQISKYEDIVNHLQDPFSPIPVSHALPDKTWHGYRYIKFGPDGKLYVGIGMPCNTCIQDDERYGTLSRISLQRPEHVEVFAKGLRNSVGFDWDPEDGSLWFTDNGQDLLGDTLPPEEINRAPNNKMDFGFPYFYGQNVPAPHFGALKKSVEGMTPPVFELPPHTAPLGMAFYTGKSFPKDYRNDIFVALHGSWNSSKKVGYEVVRLNREEGKAMSFKPFISGWLGEDKQVWGRPVDVLVMPDGALLISDDMAGVIYRVQHT